MDIATLPDGFYRIFKQTPTGPEDECVVKLYTCPDSNVRGFGYGIWDGCGFLPVTDLAEGVKVEPFPPTNVIQDLVNVQGSSGNWNYDPYMHGMYNGMELVLAVLERREPVYKTAPDVWLSDLPSSGKLETHAPSEGK